MHRPQLKGHLVLAVNLRRVQEHLGDVAFHLGQDDPRVLLAFGLRRGGHVALQLLGYDDVADLDGQDRDAPGVRLLLDLALELLVKLVAVHGYVRDVLAADGVTKGRLRRHRDGVVVVLHLEADLFGVPDHPEHRCVHVHGNQVGRQRFLCREPGKHDAHVGAQRHVLHERYDEEQPGAYGAVVGAKTKDHDAFPLRRDAHGAGDEDRGREAHA